MTKFDFKQFLTENKLTKESKALYEMHGDSDGDREADKRSEAKAEEHYQAGLEAYNAGDLQTAEKHYQEALKAGAWLGWGERDLPPYGSKLGEDASNTNPDADIVQFISDWFEESENEEYQPLSEEEIAEIVSQHFPSMSNQNKQQVVDYIYYWTGGEEADGYPPLADEIEIWVSTNLSKLTRESNAVNEWDGESIQAYADAQGKAYGQKTFSDGFSVLDFFGGALPQSYEEAKMKANQEGYILPTSLFDQAAMMAADGESEEIVEYAIPEEERTKIKEFIDREFSEGLSKFYNTVSALDREFKSLYPSPAMDEFYQDAREVYYDMLIDALNAKKNYQY